MNSLKKLDRVSLKDGEITCIVGVLPNERTETQKIRFSISMYLDTRMAAKKCDLYHSSDYSLVKNLLERLLSEGKFRLLETAADAIAHLLLDDTFCSQLGSPEILKITLSKPEIFDGPCSPEVRITRSADDLQQDLGNDEIFKCSDLKVLTDEERGFVVEVF